MKKKVNLEVVLNKPGIGHIDQKEIDAEVKRLLRRKVSPGIFSEDIDIDIDLDEVGFREFDTNDLDNFTDDV